MEQRPQRADVDRAVAQRVAGAPPARAEAQTQDEAHQGAPLRRSQDRIGQLEQAILAPAQVVVQLLAEVAERRQYFGIKQNPERGTIATRQKPPTSPWAFVGPNSKS